MSATRMLRLAAPRLALTVGPRRRIGEIGMSDVTLIDSEHAFDAADHAADRGADDGADRAGDPVTFMEPMRSATRDALRLRHHGSRKNRKNRA